MQPHAGHNGVVHELDALGLQRGFIGFVDTDLVGLLGCAMFIVPAALTDNPYTAVYLLTVANFPYAMAALVIGTITAGVVGYLVGLIALRRTGIYFAMITVAIGEVFFFVEFNPLSARLGGIVRRVDQRGVPAGVVEARRDQPCNAELAYIVERHQIARWVLWVLSASSSRSRTGAP